MEKMKAGFIGIMERGGDPGNSLKKLPKSATKVLRAPACSSCRAILRKNLARLKDIGIKP